MLLIGVIPAAVSAQDSETIVYIRGTVAWVDDAYCMCLSGGLVDPGDPVIGYYVYSTNTPDSDPDPHRGEYHHTETPYGMYLFINDLEFRTDPEYVDFLFIVGDSMVVGEDDGLDRFLIRSINNLDVVGHPDNLEVELMSWYLLDSTRTAVSSDSILEGPPVLDDWQEYYLSITGNGFGGPYTIAVDIDYFPTGIARQDPPDYPRIGSIWPNPSKGVTNIEVITELQHEAEFQVFDVTGRHMFTQAIHAAQPGSNIFVLDSRGFISGDLPSGVYFIRLVTPSSSATRKFVITR
jgi:hypothetical protein